MSWSAPASAPACPSCARTGCVTARRPQMQRAGAGLVEIGQVLRHRHAATTTIYARTDPEALIELAWPWPRGGAS